MVPLYRHGRAQALGRSRPLEPRDPDTRPREQLFWAGRWGPLPQVSIRRGAWSSPAGVAELTNDGVESSAASGSVPTAAGPGSPRAARAAGGGVAGPFYVVLERETGFSRARGRYSRVEMRYRLAG
jgi:hypothetical protein